MPKAILRLTLGKGWDLYLSGSLRWQFWPVSSAFARSGAADAGCRGPEAEIVANAIRTAMEYERGEGRMVVFVHEKNLAMTCRALTPRAVTFAYSKSKEWARPILLLLCPNPSAPTSPKIVATVTEASGITVPSKQILDPTSGSRKMEHSHAQNRRYNGTRTRDH